MDDKGLGTRIKSVVRSLTSSVKASLMGEGQCVVNVHPCPVDMEFPLVALVKSMLSYQYHNCYYPVVSLEVDITTTPLDVSGYHQ
jgi:hypothetical protein